MHMENYEYGEFPVTLKMTSKLLQSISNLSFTKI